MLLTLWNSDDRLVQWGCVLAVSLVAAGTDLARRRIPNWLTIPTLVVGLGFAEWTGGGAGVLDGVLGCLLLAFPYVLLFLFAGGGAGDAKLMGALGAWLGVVNGALVLVCVAASGVLLGVGYALAKRRTRAVFREVSGVMIGWIGAGMAGSLPSRPAGEARTSAGTIPYGVAIAMGVALSAAGVVLWRV